MLAGLRFSPAALWSLMLPWCHPISGIRRALVEIGGALAPVWLLQVGALVLEAFPPRGIIHFLDPQHTQGDRPVLERLVSPAASFQENASATWGGAALQARAGWGWGVCGCGCMGGGPSPSTVQKGYFGLRPSRRGVLGRSGRVG
jgi:hypothetical protein